jgi:hypothetical protein
MNNSSTAPYTSQWQRLLKNAGTWQGSFTQLSAQGDILSDVPTTVALIPQNDDQAMRQEIHRYPPGEVQQTKVLEYSSLNRATLFFEDGAFSQGSTQWGPFSQFGAELGLISGERRLRIVQLFEPTGEFKLTLIREQLKGSNAPERPHLSVTDLMGTWQGEAVTQYADLRPEQRQKSQLVIEQVGAATIRQTITLPDISPLSSIGTVAGQMISFTEGSQPVQVMLLPDGASATFPSKITPRQPLFLEAGWLLSANTRQRMIRTYDAAGAWLSLTLVTEHKQFA